MSAREYYEYSLSLRRSGTRSVTVAQTVVGVVGTARIDLHDVVCCMLMCCMLYAACCCGLCCMLLCGVH